MKKTTNEEKARLEELADKYHQKINEDREMVHNTLNREQQLFLKGANTKIADELREHLKSGKKPSDYFKTKGNWLFEGCILKRHKEALFYLIDNVRAYVIQGDWGRISYRSSDYSFYQSTIQHIITEFYLINWIDVDYADFLENNLSEEQVAYKSWEELELSESYLLTSDSYLLTYEIDAGNERVINYIKNTLENGSAAAISRGMLAAIFRCKNTELHELICRLLLTANPEEGLLRAICANYDYGRIESFLMVLKTIRDNGLIRYPFVKGFTGCVISLLTRESSISDLERINAKSLDIIINCLEDENYIEECFSEEDSMKIYIALWAIGFREINRCIEKLFQIIDRGSSLQAMTAGIFIKNSFGRLEIYFPPENVLKPHHFAVQAVLKRHEELAVMAIYLPLMEHYNMGWSHLKRKHGKIDMVERYSKEDAESLYVILNEMLTKLPKNKLEFKPCVFPWNTAYLTKSDILKPLCVIAADLEDNTKIDETCVKIPLIKKEGWWYDREVPIRMLLSEPKTEVQLGTLVSFACDKQKNARKAVFAILNECQLNEKHFRALEDMLRYKSDDMRQGLIGVLCRQSEEQLFACAKRLCMDEKEEKRTAGLDMLIKICQSDRDDNIKFEYKALIQFIKNPSSKEQILIDRINLGEGYGLYRESDDFTPTVDEEFIANCKADFVKLFPETKLFGNKPKGEKIGMHDIISALDKLIEEHKNDEYVDSYAGKCLLGNDSIDRSYHIIDDEGNRCIFFKELWDEFYKQYIDDENLLLKLNIYITPCAIKFILYRPGSDKFTNKIYGNEFIKKHTYTHFHTIAMVMDYYYDSYLKAADYDTIACALGYYIAYEAKAESLYDFIDSDRKYDVQAIYLDGKKMEFKNMEGKIVTTILADQKTDVLLSMLSMWQSKNKDYFKNAFSIRFMLEKRFGFFDMIDGKKNNYHLWSNSISIYTPLAISDLILTAYTKIISQGFLYKMLMTNFLSSALHGLSQLISYKKSGEAMVDSGFYSVFSATLIKNVLEIQDSDSIYGHKLSAEENKKLNFAVEIGENLLEAVLNVELARDANETEFSKEIGNIKRIYGGENFVKILTAIGKDKLHRSTSFSTDEGVSKKQALSYLLSVCVPVQEDNAAKLKELLAATDITEERLAEAALFSTAWLDIIEDYLGWKPCKSLVGASKT